MVTYIFDIDGTLVYHHTNKWLPGALDMIESLHNEGHQIILITRRSRIRDAGTEWSPEETELKLLTDLDRKGIDYTILYDVDSPRILIDDRTPKAKKRTKNEAWI